MPGFTWLGINFLSTHRSFVICQPCHVGLKHRLHIICVQQFIQVVQLPIVVNSNTTLVKRSPTFDTFDAHCQVYVYSEESGGVELQEREVSNVILHPNLWTYDFYLTKFSRAAAGWWRIPNVSEEHAGSSEEESLPHQVSLCWGQSRRWVFPYWRNYNKQNLLSSQARRQRVWGSKMERLTLKTLTLALSPSWKMLRTRFVEALHE